jgi:phage shock protein PspC (stress-responsive transcriptional regulator)
MIGGVAGGLAEYFDIDPVITRAIFIVLFFAWGTSLLAYIILWIIVPDERKLWERNNPGNSDTSERNDVPDEVYEAKRGKRKNFLAYVLIILGAALLVHRFIIWIELDFVIPVLLIIAGTYMLYRSAFKPHRQEVS